MSAGGDSVFAQFKLVLLGESAVGKSSIVYRFIKDQFDEFRESTIGAAFLTQSINLDSQTTIKFEIWDTAGQERYKSLAPMYYRNANCAVVVYDVTNESSLLKAKYWVNELKKYSLKNKDIVIALVGNKIDLKDRKVDKNLAFEYSREENLLFFEVSAKTGEGVYNVFEQIARKLPINQAKDNKHFNNISVDLNKSNTNESSCLC